MTDFRRLNPMLAIMVALTLAACGGGGGGTATTAPTDAGSAATTGPTEAATDAPPTDAPPTAAPATNAPAGGGGVADVCGLVTAEELAGIFDVSSVVLTVFEGPPDTCDIQSGDGARLAATVLTTAQASLVFDAVTGDPSSIEVSGIGDKAAIAANTGLVVLKGDALLVISISWEADLTEDEVIDVSKQIGTIAAGRM